MICEGCQAEFVPTGHRPERRRFCSPDCTRAYARSCREAKTVETTARRFWQRVAKSDDASCWEWRGYRNPHGYGQASYLSRVRLSHRIAFMLSSGTTIPRGMYVLHRCDNPACCNPGHLFLGNQQANIDDARQKGRLKNPTQMKLDAKTASDIRRKYGAGQRPRDLAVEYGVTAQMICAIGNRRAWRHIP